MCRTWGSAAIVLSVFATTSCNLVLPEGCSGVGYNAVRVAIRDDQGNPKALGAVVKLYDGSYQEIDSAIYDPLNVNGAQERGGRTYDIQVSKPYYQDVWVRGVHAPGGGCVTGHESSPVTVTVPVVLTIAAGAPSVRSVHLLPPRITLDRPPYTSSVKYEAFIDASASVSHAIVWRVSGDTSSVSFDPSTGTLRYRCKTTSGSVTVTAVSAADSTVYAQVSAGVQGHPATPSDPPCS